MHPFVLPRCRLVPELDGMKTRGPWLPCVHRHGETRSGRVVTDWFVFLRKRWGIFFLVFLPHLVLWFEGWLVLWSVVCCARRTAGGVEWGNLLLLLLLLLPRDDSHEKDTRHA